MFIREFIEKRKKFYLVILVTIILLVLPFFWFSPGAIDIGGDGTRLYFYQPYEFLKNVSIYSPAPEGKGDIDPSKHAYFIYAGFLSCLLFVFKSPYIIICLLHGVKLAVGFLCIYFIVKEFIKGYSQKKIPDFSAEMAAVTAGIFYIVATGSEKLIFFWEKSLFSHDQVFLNPLMFLLLLRFLLTQNRYYIFVALLISFIFSANFSMIAAPAFFAFYPLTTLFLLVYILYIRKKNIPLKELCIVLILFIGLQSFHLFPEVATLFDKGSITNTVVFKDVISGGLNFFIAIHSEGKASMSLFLPSPDMIFRVTSFLAPLIIITSFLFEKRKYSEILLTSVFFLITFFLVSVNITNIGYLFYQKLFYIPGFSIFRHFFVQWAFVFIFFYALLFGQCYFVILSKLKKKYAILLTIIVITLFVLSFWSFLSGKLINGIQWGSKNVKTAMIMDPRYEQSINFLRTLPEEGKILILPLTSYYHQIVFGTNNAAYVGPTTISYITSKKSFAGYQHFYPYPIPEDMMKFAKEKNYKALTQLFSLFNIRYIFHNTDPQVYEQKFPLFPNDYMMTAFPKTQEEYKQFVKKFPVKQIYKNGMYEIFVLDKKVYRPELYIPTTIYKEDMIATIGKKEVPYTSAFIDETHCNNNNITLEFCKKNYSSPITSIKVTKKNPTEYYIHIKQTKSDKPFLLVFQNSFHHSWRVRLIDKPFIDEVQHIPVNVYANGWIITKKDRNNQQDYTLILTLESQKYFWYGLLITGFSCVVLLLWLLFSIEKRKNVYAR